MPDQPSRKVKSTMRKDEELVWYSRTNVIPSVITAIPRLLLVGGFFGVWSGIFFGSIASLIFGTFILVIIIGVLSFLAPVVFFAIATLYESSKEEFAVTDSRIVTLTANRMNIDTNAYDRSDIKQIGVEQGFVGDIMSVGNITIEIFQTDMQTDKVVLEGIDNPYKNLEELQEILSEDIEKKD